MKLKKITALKKGFTLIELLVVMGIIAVLIAVVAVAVNPGRQFANLHDTQRQADLYKMVGAVYKYAAENKGTLPSQLTTTPTNVGTDTGLIDLTSLVPNYFDSVPMDPNGGTAGDTKYVIFKNGNKVVASASGEITPNITLSE